VKRVLVDTGPLVAILSERDQYHRVCVEALRELPGPLFSSWPVITEAAWLLRSDPSAVQQLLRSLGKGFVELLPLGSVDASAMAEIMKKYADMRPELADVSLVYLAQRDGFEVVFTLDQRDFSVYRGAKGKAFEVVPRV
jgi:uncharacterized protein